MVGCLHEAKAGSRLPHSKRWRGIRFTLMHMKRELFTADRPRVETVQVEVEDRLLARLEYCPERLARLAGAFPLPGLALEKRTAAQKSRTAVIEIDPPKQTSTSAPGVRSRA